GTSSFEECDNLYAVKFGAGVRKLPQFCFYGCDVLQNVIIPETVYDMDNSVFERSGLGYLKLPQSMHYISSTAFKDCAKLTKVDCSDELERIGDYAFERCYEFTTLNTAVKDIDFNNSTFKDCPKFTDKRFFVFNPANTGIESTANIGVDHTLVHFTVKYDIRDDWKDDDTTMRRLILNYPNNLDVITNSFVAEGFDFDNMTYSGDYRSFDLTGAKTRGELRFSAYLNLSDDVAKSLTAEVSFRHMGTDFQKPLGDVQLTTAKISLFAPSSVTEPKISVSGYSAAADKDVSITMTRVKDGASVTHTVTPNPYTGKYTAENLDILPEGKTAVNDEVFEVYAVSDGKKSDVIRFTYTPGAIRVVKATETVNIKKFTGPHQTNLSHGTQTNTYDITGVFTKGTAPVVLINPVEMLQFQIQLENDENICALVLMSHKGSDWRFMPLFYDAETDMWIGEGYFNIPDHELVQGYNYVPGAFNLFWFYGKREDTYKSHFYGGKSDEAVGDGPSLFGGEEEEIFYYDKDGKPHGNLGDYHDTFWETVKDVFVDIVTGEWTDVPKDATVGGLKGLWEWGNTDDNFFRMTHGGVRLGPDGLPILPGDGADMYNHDASKDGRQRNAIDPSGMVYEAVEGNPVEGATATIYKRNEDTGEWEIWNAADYEQENPLLTNNEGAYAWLTDEGRFKVTITKEGYEPQTSEEFDIPPEKLGLNFSLVDKTTHPKATVTANEQAGSYTLKFSKFMQTDTVNTDTVQTEGLTDVTITPVYLADGDAYADTFLVTGTKTQRAVTFSVTDAARSYSDVAAEASSETITTSILGDVNGDGKIDITDATLIQLHVAQSRLLEGEDFAVADVNGDNKVDITDATLIQLHTAGMKSF
ncbi:MAG: leucine-rich repeat protein, partial [Ruminococcus sp.]|nr:leucine-rich repeat protein [Ruminococcus sp.]